MSIKSQITRSTLKKLEKITGASLTLGSLIQAIRQADEVTQAEFGKTLGISKQQLSDIENNRKIVSPKLAAAYAEKLGYSADQFVRLALQQSIDRAGLNLVVEIKPGSRSCRVKKNPVLRNAL